MKWAVFNVFGAVAWLAGLSFARGAQVPIGGFIADADHRLMIGLVCGTAGLLTLLWVNLRSTT